MRFPLQLIPILLVASLLTGCMGNGISVVSPTEAASTSATEHIDSDILRPDPTDISAFRLNQTEKSALAMLAGIRSERALPALTVDEKLCALAYIRAVESYQQFSHTRPDDRDYSSIFADFGYSCSGSAELICYMAAPLDPEEAFSVWLDDKALAKKLTDPTFTHVGFGLYRKGEQAILLCLLTK